MPPALHGAGFYGEWGSPVTDWIREHESLLWWVGAGSLGVLVGSVLLIPLLITRMPTDYFVTRKPPEESWGGRHPLLRLLILTGKNLLGLVFIIAGVAMLILPGQGILTIFIGFMVLDFPGKRRLELRLVRLRRVLGTINWIRRRAGSPPLHVPENEFR